MQEAGIDVHQVSYSRYNESLVQKELDRWWGYFIPVLWFIVTTCFAGGEEGIVTHKRSVTLSIKRRQDKACLLVLFYSMDTKGVITHHLIYSEVKL